MHKDSNRPRRVGELLKRELSAVIRQQLHDPRAGHVTLTAVDVAPDLKSAKVFFTCMAGEQDVAGKTEALNHASGFLRHCLRDRVELRGIPALRFIYDESIERGARLSGLIDGLAVHTESGK